MSKSKNLPRPLIEYWPIVAAEINGSQFVLIRTMNLWKADTTESIQVLNLPFYLALKITGEKISNKKATACRKFIIENWMPVLGCKKPDKSEVLLKDRGSIDTNGLERPAIIELFHLGDFASAQDLPQLSQPDGLQWMAVNDFVDMGSSNSKPNVYDRYFVNISGSETMPVLPSHANAIERILGCRIKLG